jgi:hypothetical protein
MARARSEHHSENQNKLKNRKPTVREIRRLERILEDNKVASGGFSNNGNPWFSIFAALAMLGAGIGGAAASSPLPAKTASTEEHPENPVEKSTEDSYKIYKKGNEAEGGPFPAPKIAYSVEDALRSVDPLGLDRDVSNNHDEDMRAFPQVAFQKLIVNQDDAWVQWWLYFKDNPVCLAAVNGKCLVTDHHTHDWEVIIDHYVKGQFVERATSYHIKVPGLSPGWFVTNQQGYVYVESGGHGLSPEHIFDTLAKFSTDAKNKEPLFGWRVFTSQDKDAPLLEYSMDTLEQNAKTTQESGQQFKTSGYPAAASKLLGKRALNPWHQDAYSKPWLPFGGKALSDLITNSDSENAARQPSFLAVEVIGEDAESSFNVADKALGTKAGQVRTNVYGNYFKVTGKERLVAVFDNYELNQVEVSAAAKGNYKIIFKYLDVNAAHPKLITEVVDKEMNAGDKYVFKIINNKPEVVDYVRGPANIAGGNGAEVAVGIAAAIFTALGVGHVIKEREKRKAKK